MKSFVKALPAVTTATALGALLTVAAHAEPVPYRSLSGNGNAGGGMTVQTQSAPVKTQVLRLPKGRSAVIDLPVDAADVFVSNPAVADAVLRTPRRIFVLGVEGGQSDAIFFDGMGRQILNLSIRVEAATDELGDTVHRLFPNSHVDVQSLNGRIILSGLAQSDGQADQILHLAASYAAKPEDVINLMSIAGKDQVTLKVRIVEVERSVIKQLGLATDVVYNNGTQSYAFGRANSYGATGTFQGGKGMCYNQNNTVKTTTTVDDSITTPINDPNTGVTGTLTDAFTSTFDRLRGMNNLSCLQAFERVGLIRTLAEPNLTAVSGEAAKFLAGGEFPVPVAQDSQGRITVEFKPFGVGLGFTPVVLSGGRISMKLSTEVSELTNTGSFALNSNFTIPALSVRRAETTVEMQSGSSLMIAGLLQSKYKQSIDSLPGLTSLPVLGALFRSRDFLNDETELVVIVTPYIVDPTHPDQMQTPADNLEPGSDAADVFLGRINKVIAAGAETSGSPVAAPTGPYSAPIGYVIE